MMNWWSEIDSSVTRNLLSTLILLVSVLLARFLSSRALVQREGLSVEMRRRWRVSVRNALLIVVVFGLIFIWASELRTFAVSLVAIAVAVVIATKELLLCISGAVLRAGGKVYSVGDLIEISGMRGFVVDHTMFSTTLVEIGPGHAAHMQTGRTVVFPNSLLLSAPLRNETSLGKFVVHFITVPLSVRDDWQAAEKLLLEAAHAECRDFLDAARSHMRRLADQHWLDTPSVEPRISVHIPEADKLTLLLRIPAPMLRKGAVEQAILRRFLTQCQAAGIRSSLRPSRLR